MRAKRGFRKRESKRSTDRSTDRPTDRPTHRSTAYAAIFTVTPVYGCTRLYTAPIPPPYLPRQEEKTVPETNAAVVQPAPVAPR